MSCINAALNNCEDFFCAIRILYSISHTLANTGNYFLKSLQLWWTTVIMSHRILSVIQDKFLVFCNSILLISLLDFVNVWQCICRISKINWTNLENRLPSFMKNNQMLSLKPLDLKPFKSGIHLLSWMQNGTELIECTVTVKGMCKLNW